MAIEWEIFCEGVGNLWLGIGGPYFLIATIVSAVIAAFSWRMDFGTKRKLICAVGVGLLSAVLFLGLGFVWSYWRAPVSLLKKERIKNASLLSQSFKQDIKKGLLKIKGIEIQIQVPVGTPEGKKLGHELFWVFDEADWKTDFDLMKTENTYSDLFIRIPENEPQLHELLVGLATKLGFTESIVVPDRSRRVNITIGQGYK